MATLHLQVPKKTHFEIVGRGGQTAQRIQTQFGVRIKVPNKDEPTTEVTIVGPADKVEAAKHEIEKIVGFKLGTSPLVLLRLDIPEDQYGAIIGRAGATLKELEGKFNVNIDVPRAKKDGDCVEIEGPKEGVLKAKEEIGRLVRGNFRVVATDGADVVEQSTGHLAPLELEGHPIHEALFFPDESGQNFTRFIHYLHSAKRTIDVCVFTITDDRISNVLEDLHRGGVRVRVITDNDTSVQEGSDIDKFRRAGIPVKMDKSPHHMHHKFAVLDGVCMINGSFNWTRSASVSNCENVMVTNHAEFVRQFGAHFESMWNDRARFE